jgi:peroxiredoxin Q/BCP
MSFPFELLADEDRLACELFEVWKEKSMYGRKYMGVERSTFLLDADGVLRHEWRKVKVPGHADEVLAAAKAL